MCSLGKHVMYVCGWGNGVRYLYIRVGNLGFRVKSILVIKSTAHTPREIRVITTVITSASCDEGHLKKYLKKERETNRPFSLFSGCRSSNAF